MRSPSWSDQERIAALVAYEGGGIHAVMAMFPNLARHCIQERLRKARGWKWEKKPWTTLEVARLNSLWRKGVPVDDIAEQMQRTPASIRQRVRVDKLPPRTNAHYTPGQLRVIADAADQMVSALSQRLGHPPASIQNKLVGSLMKRAKRKRAQLLEVA